jgi:hypothetical protein
LLYDGATRTHVSRAHANAMATSSSSFTFDHRALDAARRRHQQQQAPSTTSTATSVVVSGAAPRRPPALVGRPATEFAWLLGTLGVGVGVVGVLALLVPNTGAPDELGKRFSQYTNVLFVWPVIGAMLVGAHRVAGVIALALAASVAHHGCLYEPLSRVALADETFVVALVAGAALALAFGWSFARRYSRACGACFALVALTALVLVLVPALVAAPATLDGCLRLHDAAGTGYTTYIDEEAPDLVRVWAAIDDLTAVATLAVVTGDFFRAPADRALPLAAVLGLGALAAVLALYSSAGYVTQTSAFLVLVVSFVVYATWQACACATARGGVRREYRVLEIVGALLLGTAALLLFFFDNTAGAHGFWHVLAALALLLLVDASPEMPRAPDERALTVIRELDEDEVP